jgi:hypothetical protein
LIGPIFSDTVAAISVSDFFSRLSHPGMLAFSTSGSLSAFHTSPIGASIVSSPSMFTAMNVSLALGVRPNPAARACPSACGRGHGAHILAAAAPLQ